MTDESQQQVDAFITPGSLLRTARLEQGISERETADRLNLMPGYIAVLERDDYDELRAPAFARGYVKAYGQLLDLDEPSLLAAFDELRDSRKAAREQRRTPTRPLQLQRTGLGVIVGLAVLGLVVVALWWWQTGQGNLGSTAPEAAVEQGQAPLSDSVATGDS